MTIDYILFGGTALFVGNIKITWKFIKCLCQFLIIDTKSYDFPFISCRKPRKLQFLTNVDLWSSSLPALIVPIAM